MTINKESQPKVYAALPVLNERENIPLIINNLLEQQDVETELIICVNQPDEWWNIPEKLNICLNNQSSIDYIKSLENPNITLIDKSTKGNGWIGRKHGVGWARKVAMDVAAAKATDDAVLISVDADTWYPTEYFSSVISGLNKHPEAVGLSAPYYHLLTSDPIADKCILRYEIYMRNYALNMLLINNPYSFSAIGSGMACSASVYRKVCGLTPKLSGEDFYFMQKLRKAGRIVINCESEVYPASRFSDRVYFGTGPAMIKGRAGIWDSYPIYSKELFTKVKMTFDLLSRIYHEDVETPMDSFLKETFLNESSSIKELWEPLRKNSSTVNQFIKAVMQKVDALRILQFLKKEEVLDSVRNEERLYSFLVNNLNPDKAIIESLQMLISNGFEELSVTNLNIIRDFMYVNERRLQRERQLA